MQRALIASAAGVFVLGLMASGAHIALPVGAVLALAGWAFSSLSVEVSPGELAWYFGPGLFQKHIPRDEIVSAAPVQNSWWWGWGIHLTPRGWLYNVGGLEAVEIVMRDGKRFRIGSDDAAMLARARTGGPDPGR
ncbi:MAG: hypothetical protein ACR652_21830 [Methylocystis sp.]|uniref:hypothetical protein n=1 Tax=Methylocystis sp. TaxID=1911079 RepID=UPI003DA23A03